MFVLLSAYRLQSCASCDIYRNKHKAESCSRISYFFTLVWFCWLWLFTGDPHNTWLYLWEMHHLWLIKSKPDFSKLQGSSWHLQNLYAVCEEKGFFFPPHVYLRLTWLLLGQRGEGFVQSAIQVRTPYGEIPVNWCILSISDFSCSKRKKTHKF